MGHRRVELHQREWGDQLPLQGSLSLASSYSCSWTCEEIICSARHWGSSVHLIAAQSTGTNRLT